MFFLKKPYVMIVALMASASFCRSQAPLFKDSITIQAKIWSKDENKQVHYSDWNTFVSHRVTDMAGINSRPSENSVTPISTTTNPFYHTEQINGRWYVVSSNRQPFLVMAVNSIRTLGDSNSPDGFSSVDDWMSTTIDSIRKLGFNTAGCWSDTGAIIRYNHKSNQPLPYTVQLNLLNGFASQQKKINKELKELSVLSFLFEDVFSDYCRERCRAINYLTKDVNLLGYFSDNELPFTNNEIRKITEAKNPSDKCFQAIQSWMKEKGLDSLASEDKKKIMGYLADRYYKTVSAAIRTADPNHMYLGSRLHSNAKNNRYLFQASNAYIDIYSINYYGDWEPRTDYLNDWLQWTDKPFFITEFYTKAESTGLSNKSGAGWIVKTQEDRGVHYQNFCLKLLQNKNCIGWHWFRYQDNDPNDAKADDSNKDSNKGLVDIRYRYYNELTSMMAAINNHIHVLVALIDKSIK